MKEREGDQNIVKSIIYGSSVQGSYGMLRGLCSAINSKDHIDKIILYLRSNQNFQKYNKFVYAFRLEHHGGDLFITENSKQSFLEGYNDDTGLEGNGQRLLSLLQKFNVRSVLVIVAVRQKDPLKQFKTQHYMEVVRCAKDLLSSLYDKVIMSKAENYIDPTKIIMQKELLQVKTFQTPINTFMKVNKKKANINYVGQQYKRKFEPINNISKLKIQIKYLNEKIQQLASSLQQIIQNFGESEDEQVKFSVQYDNNVRVKKVFTMLALLFGLPSKEYFLEIKMSDCLRTITSRSLTAIIIRRLNGQLMSDKTLKSSVIVNESKICGILLQFMEVLLNSYSFARRLAIIQSEIQQGQDMEPQQEDQLDQKELKKQSSSLI